MEALKKNGLMRRAALMAALFFVCIFIFTGLLVLSAKIPRDAIRTNMKESGKFLSEGKLFYPVISGVAPSEIDRYADAILLNIAWHLDPERPLSSAMWTSYYDQEGVEETKSFAKSVLEDIPANKQYMRYWHGSAVIVSFLHLFLNLKGIYILNAFLILILTVFLMWTLTGNKLPLPAAGIIISLISISVWFVPLSLEYTWTVLLMLVFSIAAVRAELRENFEAAPFIFLLSGMVTAYLDFLTAETLTLTVPLILIIYIRLYRLDHPVKEGRELFIGSVLSWGAGYIGAWGSKWVLAAMITGEDILQYVGGHVEERLGDTYGLSPFTMLTGALTKNLSCLFPFGYGTIGFLLGLALILFLSYILFVYRKDKGNEKAPGILILTGLIPYVRFMALMNHSYIHYFFTFRAQAAMILALTLVFGERTDLKRLIPRSLGWH